ncbi:Septin [Aphelenchoides bicaudatus]|nr:Septin [Aphelenchoides bicaudatus]
MFYKPLKFSYFGDDADQLPRMHRNGQHTPNTALNDSLIGFSTFPDQVFRRCIKNGFDFTMMVVGESGLGKSTFINSLFLAEINDVKQPRSTTKTTEVSSKSFCLEEEGVRLKITFVDTPGFGDHVDNTDCWKPIVNYVESRFTEYLNEETRIERPSQIEDKRVHLCLYFVAPRRGLSELDILAMKALQDRVNIVPVIAKADTLMPDELQSLKKKLLEDFTAHEIKLYEFPAPDENKKDAKDYRDRIPFAVVGSNELRDNGRTKSRVRKYMWGTVEVDNLEHNDFIALRDILINQNMVDLIDVTRDVHYENFRSRQMRKNPKGVLSGDEDPFTRMEKEQRAQERAIENAHATKEKIFADKVAERMIKLEDEERKLHNQELEYNKVLADKRNELARIQQEIHDYRLANGMGEPGHSSNGHSPDGMKKKKSTILALF